VLKDKKLLGIISITTVVENVGAVTCPHNFINR
jgi:hypothetical protein